jgi:hypothetical protein
MCKWTISLPNSYYFPTYLPMHETYFLSQNLAFLGIYIIVGEFDTFFSYLGGFVPLGIYIYGDLATLFLYLDGFVRFCITFTTSLSPTCIYSWGAYHPLSIPWCFCKTQHLHLHKHFEKILARALLIAKMVGVAINKRKMKKKT